MLFEHPDFDRHELVAFHQDHASGLKAIVALHDTRRGPALGGCRMYPYATTTGALTDALRLSRGMTFKAALAGLPLGGGKAVIIGHPVKDKSPARLAAFGRLVEGLGGRYITAEDSGTTVRDMAAVLRETDHVGGRPAESGDPSPLTALGVFEGLKAAVAHRLGRAQGDLTGLAVAVQGLGNVGMHLAEHLSRAGCQLKVADVSAAKTQDAANRFGATVVPVEAVLAQNVDVIAPCALGAILDDRTIPDLKAAVVAGAANNQLAEARHGHLLAEAGIAYAPDYAINAGGLINIAEEAAARAAGRPYDRDRAVETVNRIGPRIGAILGRAAAEGRPPSDVADHMAAEILAGA